ncbi:putative oxygen-dependent FAD-linked oxidoreductase family protein [Lyophyllum shimeji]|uniref:Oxygen-dependent FAD-linked oxidoreductase family protein n=1 Tax=Lyophyllum shimeji TaxID=47721 RepID=A0A9P3PMR6_LYOSH|nr:putative oxygen-dependent FAD-linked oxidoreductase family protein [Lyophyllum shimeji]
MSSNRSRALACLPFFFAVLGVSAGQQPLLYEPPASEWHALKKAVNGRLFEGVPFAHPCFAKGFNSTECVAIRSSYLDEVSRANAPAAYIQTQWETCQTTDDGCLLSYTNPQDESPTLPPNQCQLGSIPRHFIDVRNAEDVAAAFRFSRRTGMPLVIKNTGHDYKGRSSAPHSLALWTHNLKDISFDPAFVAEGCSKASPGVTVGAGVQWGEAYAFAEANNITLVGGSDRSVGVAGGWLQGGGHGALSNTMGLGVDRVLQYKVVTPDGVYRTANECQNQDLFFGLRGGGGGTFGVVLESTILASPQVTLQAVIVTFSANTTRTKELWTILADNGLKWADEGWGGFSMAGILILINPGSSKEETAKSMAPLIAYGKRLQSEGVQGASTIVTEFPSWGAFFNAFTKDHVAVVGSSLALASRLISKDNLKTPARRSTFVSALLAADAATPGLIVLITAPSSFPSKGQTSVTDAWRSSLYHVTVVSPWEWNATVAEKKAHYSSVSASIDHLRKITPDAAYLNEADVYEPNHEVAFWGSHHTKLLKIKRKYDPDRLLDCWQCVGWDPKSPRFSCYL